MDKSIPTCTMGTKRTKKKRICRSNNIMEKDKNRKVHKKKKRYADQTILSKREKEKSLKRTTARNNGIIVRG